MRLGVNGRFYAARVTGVQRFAREVVARLARREAVTIFLPRGVPEPDVPATIVRGTLPGKLWEQTELPWTARTVDVVLHPANVAPLSGPPGVLVLHDVVPFTHGDSFNPLYGAWARTVAARGARRALRVVTVSRWAAGEIVRVLGLPPGRVEVVTQGVAPLDAPAPPEEVAAVRARHGLAAPYFLCMAGDDPRKGLDLLLDAWAGEDGGPGAELVVVGRGYGHVHRAPGSGAALRRVGSVSDEELRALYTGSVGFLFPSTAEGFGRPPLEALACGTRVVAAPYGPASEVLGDAAKILPRDGARWREALAALVAEDPETRARHIEEGRRHAAAFCWDRATEHLARTCRDAVEAPA